MGSGLSNSFNLLYHFFMLRLLSPVDYGHLNTLIGLFMVISVPAGTVQNTVTKFFSIFKAQEQYPKARALLRHLLLWVSAVAGSFFLLIILGSSHISSFLQISSRGLVILFGLSLAFSMIIPIPWGGFQGLQKFGSLTLNLSINGGLKLILGILFVFLGMGVFGALSAITVSYFITTLLSLLILGISMSKGKWGPDLEQIRERPARYNFSEVYRYFFPVGLMLLCLMILTNIDLILVKHFFTPREAGYYSIAQIVGKIVFVLPLPIGMVMFPKIASLKMEIQEKKALSVLMHCLVIAALLCGGATLLSFLFPSLIIRVLSGKVYPECIPLVGIFSVNMSLFALTLILFYYQLATDEKGFLYPLLSLTLIQSGLILLFHKTSVQVLMVVTLISFSLWAINLGLVFWPYKSNGRERSV